MISTPRLSLVAAAVALAGGLASTSAKADAVAQAILGISNFHFALGNGNATRAADGSLLGSITVVSATTTADSSVELNGVNASGATSQTDPLSFAGAASTSTLGSAGTYVPGAALIGAPVATFGASHGSQVGNSLIATSSGVTDGLVSLMPAGDGSTTSNVNFQSEFVMDVVGGTRIEIAFDASSFLRGYLSTAGVTPPTATAATTWTLTMRNNTTGATIFRWSPDGLVGAITGGTEYVDDFALNDSVSQLTPGNAFINNASGSFQAETNALAEGRYTVSLRQSSLTDAFLKLPEPASLGLLGVALVGAGVASRRRSK